VTAANDYEGGCDAEDCGDLWSTKRNKEKHNQKGDFSMKNGNKSKGGVRK
jgi:hypothetical protein